MDQQKEDHLDSPIIRRDNNKYILGLHFGDIDKKNKIYSFNLATIFDSILKDIYKSNEIIYINQMKLLVYIHLKIMIMKLNYYMIILVIVYSLKREKNYI